MLVSAAYSNGFALRAKVYSWMLLVVILGFFVIMLFAVQTNENKQKNVYFSYEMDYK